MIRSEWVEELGRQTTLYSTAEEPAPGGERRSGERHITLFRVGSLLLDGQRHLCLVKNVSAGGAQIRAYCQLREGQQLSLELKEQEPLEAEVTWIQARDTGIEFKKPIDILGLLKVESEGRRPRMPRVEVRAFGFIRQGALLHRAGINNISQGGIGAQCNAQLCVGGEVTVTLAGLAPIHGVVRWARSGAYGITFNTVLGLPLLVEWLNNLPAPGKA